MTAWQRKERITELITTAQAAAVDIDIRHDPHTDFPELILNIAIQASASGIVIGLRKRPRLSKFLHRSNAQQILIEADQPVLAIKPAVDDLELPSGRRCINRTRA